VPRKSGSPPEPGDGVEVSAICVTVGRHEQDYRLP
jgi:hypothetical protein